ncbi:MAG: tRNA (adenosine(37)-N6)-threonylcarbamoyltransferase complex ATPase subunit type 1 TsaE [Bacteroidota bacterium]
MTTTVHTRSVSETKAFAASFAQQLARGDLVALRGELGAGKTQFVKGVCDAFGVRELVASPSFVILNRYSGRDQRGDELLLYHLDLYRIKSLEEVYDLGFEEFFYGDGITLVEWADLLGDLLPARRYDVLFTLGAHDNERHIEVQLKEGTGALRRGVRARVQV